MMISKNQTEPLLLRYLQITFFACAILYFGRELLVPLSYALLIGFVLYPVCHWLEKKGVKRIIAVAIAITFLLLFVFLVLGLLLNQFVNFLAEWPHLQDKLSQAFNDFSRWLIQTVGLSNDMQQKFIVKLSDQSSGNLLTVIGNSVTASAFSLVSLFLIIIYAVLILYYRHYWMLVLKKILPSEREDDLHEMVLLTIKTYYNFIKGMLVVYLFVGLLNSVGLWLLGVPHPFLFGYIASILTFIPYVGIIVGSLLPISMAWLTYDSVWYPLGVVGIFSFVQYLEANVIFPIAVSSRLNVNTLAMLLSIIVGGLLWGVSGMILFVPFVGIAKLIADHNPKWKTVSMMLGTEAKE
ncbi:MAG: AI-2E family transporter [Bacteroidetes bacterium]|nr:AI-2E family transporter [Bacteroidota bacterium]